ncbi:GNAT family N-acetyltransferase [Paludisphaera mucosa]|uniref:GNAT family N-acetyltransferase n=1 Tax=Paludisphaera mucosa TaxID=3030827 RepID=A0ABT6F809_9BACT|nr:GNAT family N-acetyltransferase [Paludisphaera mucosa]MDG3003535.1 GNAT family N-acetyltransferase [Paludisphaera mucosa]
MVAEPQMRLRIAEVVDERDVARVRSLLVAYAAEFESTIRETLRLQCFDPELAGLPGRYAGPSGILLLATVDEVPAGCVGLRDLGEGVCEMKRLYVDPAFRSLGLGKRLVENLIERASQIGYNRMVLDSTPEMTRAVALYESLGFRTIEPYGESGHALYFGKPLDRPE